MKNLFLLISLTAALLSCISCNKLKPPVAKFDFAIRDGGRVDFTNTSEGQVDEFIWEFGNGDSSMQVSPTYRFRLSGTYTVTLIAINEAGSSETTRIVEIDIETTNPMALHPKFDDANAILSAFNTFKFELIGGVVVPTAEAASKAAFYDGAGSTVLAGRLTLNGEDLVATKNNFYLGGIKSDFQHTGNMTWAAFGGNGFTTVLETNIRDFPAISPIDCKDVLNTADSVFEIKTTEPILLADSVMFLIADLEDNVMFQKNLDGLAQACVLDSVDISKLKSGSGIVWVSAFNVQQEIVSGKRINLLNESRTSKPIEIQ